MCTPEHMARIASRGGQPVQPGPMGGGSSFQPRPMFGGRTEPPAGMAPRNSFFSAKPSGSPIRDAFRP